MRIFATHCAETNMPEPENRNKKGRWPAVPAPQGRRENRAQSINATKLAILITFLKICVKGKIHYCEPYPDTTLDLIEKYHNITIQRRWFFQAMRDIEDAGLMRRRRRWKHFGMDQITSLSSLWWFTIKGAKYLKSKSIQGAHELLTSLLRWARRGDDRAPNSKDLFGADPPTDQETALRRIRDLIADIG